MILYNRQSVRLKGYDYSSCGAYFVTICTQNREMLFGDIINNKMVLNQCGKIVESVWGSLPKHHNVELDEFQIMPNHVHGIIIIDNPSMQQKSTLGNIIAYFKYQSTKQINNMQPYRKIFQRNYYEHIIRNEMELNKIRGYIKNNSLMWWRDINNPKESDRINL